jgi:DNA-directed RNA polymerase subunit RPC12/RpoP
MISSYHNALQKGWCPRCGDAFSAHTDLRNGCCPECGWPGIKKPDTRTETQWEHWKKRLREHIRKEQIREKAVAAVKKAIRMGQVERPKRCQICGRPLRHRRHRVKRGTRRYPQMRKYAYRLEAHHHSYHPDCWLEVMWVCPLCHKLIHQKEPPEYPPPDIIDVDIEDDPALLKGK